MPGPDEDDPDALYREGMQAIKERRLDDARGIADRLLELRNSGTFEIRALVLDAQGETEAAVACLEEGVSKASEVWLLWELLGNYRSDLGRYEDAAAAYERALACPSVRAGWIHLNQGVLLGRRNRPEEALSRLATVEDPELRVQVLAARLGMLLDLGRHEEAAREGTAFLETELDPEQHEPGPVARILRHVADAARVLGEDPEEVRASVLESLSWDPDSAATLSMLRELDDRRSVTARAWNVFMAGRDARMPGVGFIVMHVVVADTGWEAFEHAREIEQAIGFDALELDEVKEREEDVPHDALHGVHEVGLRHAYASEE